MATLVKRILLATVGLILALIFGGFLWLNPGRGPREEVDPYEKGWHETVEDTLVIHLRGAPYEMGYQRGYFARDKVALSVEIFDGLLDQAQEEMGLPRFAANLILDVTYQLCAPFIPERYKREMEGLADASGFNLKIFRRAHVLSVLTERACSSFTVWGNATEDGKLYHGRNFDWITSAGLEDTAVLALYEPDGFRPFASAGYAGLISVLSGMNMDGISIGQIGAITDDGSLRGLPMEFFLRRVLEECSTLDDVTGLVTSVKHTVGFNYVVGDGEARDARAYETTANHVAIFGPNDPLETVEYAIRIEDAVFRSDEAMDPVVRSLQRCANAPNMPYGSNSYDHRYLGMATRIQEHYGAINAAVALDIVKATAMKNANLHAVLTNSTDRQLWVAHAKKGQDAAAQSFVRYDLPRLFIHPDERPELQAPAEPDEAPVAEDPEDVEGQEDEVEQPEGVDGEEASDETEEFAEEVEGDADTDVREEETLEEEAGTTPDSAE